MLAPPSEWPLKQVLCALLLMCTHIPPTKSPNDVEGYWTKVHKIFIKLRGIAVDVKASDVHGYLDIRINPDNLLSGFTVAQTRRRQPAKKGKKQHKNENVEAYLRLGLIRMYAECKCLRCSESSSVPVQTPYRGMGMGFAIFPAVVKCWHK